MLLYDKLSKSYGVIEMEIPNFLTEKQLMEIYWNRINISYMSEDYMKYSGRRDDESFPMAINQLLSNSITYFESTIMSAPAAPFDKVSYCSQACERELVANGFKPCPMCGKQGGENFCNRVWKVCKACSKEKNLCVVCGQPNWQVSHP